MLLALSFFLGIEATQLEFLRENGMKKKNNLKNPNWSKNRFLRLHRHTKRLNKIDLIKDYIMLHARSQIAELETVYETTCTVIQI